MTHAQHIQQLVINGHEARHQTIAVLFHEATDLAQHVFHLLHPDLVGLEAHSDLRVLRTEVLHSRRLRCLHLYR